MLTLSHEAARLIGTLTGKAKASRGSGLRITVDSRHNSLSMALATRAMPGDVVVLGGDSAVFLSPAASRRLSGRTLRSGRPQERPSFFFT